jgi:palmitoyltransferase
MVWKQTLAKIPFLFTLFFTGFVSYNLFTKCRLLEQLPPWPLHLLTAALMLWSLYRVTFTSPGFVSDFMESALVGESDRVATYRVDIKMAQHELQEPLLQSFRVKVEKRGGPLTGPVELMQFRYCVKCEAVKPPRAHHCSVCGKCIFRMDHHCPWVGTCVGLKNHKYFINFLLWAMIACLYVVIYLAFFNRLEDSETLLQVIKRYQRDQELMLTLMISLVFALATAILLVTHVVLILKNSSTIEMTPLSFANPFTLGWRKNWKQYFGDDWRRWLLPVAPQSTAPLLDGITYPTTMKIPGDIGVPLDACEQV